jgi:hypothetical protein
MRGAPQSGLSRHNRRIRTRTSCGTTGLPALPRRISHVQNKRKPLRCQAITVSGLTMTRADRQSYQTLHSHAQSRRSAGLSLGRFTERCRTLSWCRSARLSRWSAARDLKFTDAAAAIT